MRAATLFISMLLLPALAGAAEDIEYLAQLKFTGAYSRDTPKKISFQRTLRFGFDDPSGADDEFPFSEEDAKTQITEYQSEIFAGGDASGDPIWRGVPVEEWLSQSVDCRTVAASAVDFMLHFRFIRRSSSGPISFRVEARTRSGTGDLSSGILLNNLSRIDVKKIGKKPEPRVVCERPRPEMSEPLCGQLTLRYEPQASIDGRIQGQTAIVHTPSQCGEIELAYFYKTPEETRKFRDQVCRLVNRVQGCGLGEMFGQDSLSGWFEYFIGLGQLRR